MPQDRPITFAVHLEPIGNERVDVRIRSSAGPVGTLSTTPAIAIELGLRLMTPPDADERARFVARAALDSDEL